MPGPSYEQEPNPSVSDMAAEILAGLARNEELAQNIVRRLSEASPTSLIVFGFKKEPFYLQHSGYSSVSPLRAQILRAKADRSTTLDIDFAETDEVAVVRGGITHIELAGHFGNREIGFSARMGREAESVLPFDLSIPLNNPYVSVELREPEPVNLAV